MIPSTTSAAQAVAPAPPDPGPADSAGTCACAAPARAARPEGPAILVVALASGELAPLAAPAGPRPAISGRRTLAARSSSAGYAPLASSASASSAKAASTAKSSSAKASTSKASTSKASTGPLAFLSDTKLSVDERLFRLMLYVSDKYEKELDKKLKEIQTKAGGATPSGSSSSGSTKKKSSLLGGIVDVVKTAVAPGLALLNDKGVQTIAKNVAGPVLAAGATAMGFPQAAPVLMQMGPQIVGAASQLSTSLDALGGSSGGGGGGSSSSGSTSSSSSGTPEIDQVQMMELQRLMEKQKEMFNLVSNILGSTHQTRMSIINNLRS